MRNDFDGTDLGTLIDGLADHILRDAGPAPTVVMEPVVWGEEPQHTRRWYFMVGGFGNEGFHIDRFEAEIKEIAELMRA